MTKPKFGVDVEIRLYGGALDPDRISTLLGATPTDSHRKGDRWLTATNKEVVAKTGVWRLRVIADADAIDLSHAISRLADKLGPQKVNLKDLPDIEDGYIDVYISALTDERGGATAEFGLTEHNIESLKAFGLPLRFTVAVVRP